MIKRRFDYSEQKITAQVIDETNSYLWVAFSQNESGNCVLKKVSAFQPDQVYYSIDIAVDEIVDMKISGSYIYLAYNDSSLIGAKYSLTSPLTSSTDFNIPSGITESPVAVEVNGSSVYYLIPGNSSGTNSKISEITTSGVLVENIDLSTVTKSKSFVLDSDTGDLWIVTYTSPVNLVRVYEFAEDWYYTITTLG